MFERHLFRGCANMLRGAITVLILIANSLALSPAIAQSAQHLPTDAFVAQVTGVGPSAVANKPPTVQLLTPPSFVLDERVNRLEIDGLTHYWIDNDTQTRIQELVSRASAGIDLFKPSRAGQAHLAHGKVLWLRFDVQITDTRSRWLVEIDSPVMDDVQLFWQTSGNQWMVLKAGDAVPRNLWPLRTRVPVFELMPDAKQPSQVITYYLRIENARSPISLPISLYRDSQLVADELLRTLLLGIMMGFVFLVVGSGLLMAITQRDVAFAAYVGYTIALSFYMMTSIGISAMYLWPNSPILADRMNFVTAGLTSALGPWFVSLIVNTVYQRRLLKILILAHAGLALLVTLLEAFAPSVLSYRMINLGAFFAIVLVYLMVASAWQRGEPITRWIALCFAPVALAALPLILRNLGYIPNSWLTQYSLLIASSIEIPSLLYALTLRNTQRRESRARAVGLPTHDAFTGLPNMRTFLQTLHGSITRAHRFKYGYGLILIDLTNYPWFLKEYGREMAISALVLASTRLQELARDVDCICRIDDDQFVMLVEGPCSAAQISKVATSIVALGLKPSDVLPVGASLKFQLICALMPTQASRLAGDDANAQLGWLLAQAEQLDSDPRKTIRTMGF